MIYRCQIVRVREVTPARRLAISIVISSFHMAMADHIHVFFQCLSLRSEIRTAETVCCPVSRGGAYDLSVFCQLGCPLLAQVLPAWPRPRLFLSKNFARAERDIDPAEFGEVAGDAAANYAAPIIPLVREGIVYERAPDFNICRNLCELIKALIFLTFVSSSAWLTLMMKLALPHRSISFLA
jgi:hypothetical protein